MERRDFLRAAALAPFAPPPGEEFVRPSRRDSRYLELSGGSSFIPIGLNMIAPPRAATEDESFATFESWLDKLSANRGNYIRVWLSNPFWDVEHEKSGVYDELKAKRIDRMLAMCRTRGIRVKMTIEHFRSIGEPPVRQPWADKPIHLASNGGPAKSIADFFDGEASRAQFRRKIRWYADRYGDNPTIYGWELWNEVNAVRGGDYLAWTEVMLRELHRASPKNMAMQSLGSFDTDRVRDTYRRHSLMPGNDVAQVHRYLDLGAPLEVCHGPVDILVADSIRELLRFGPKRPILLAESGAVEPKHTGPFQLYKTDRDGMILHDVLFAAFFSGAAGPGQTWHWDSYVAANDLWWHYARFAEALQGIDPPGEAFRPVALQAGPLRVYALAGKRTALIWARDARNTWTSELHDGMRPDRIENATLDLSAVPLPAKSQARVYDPWQNRWDTTRVLRRSVKLPAFRRSLVVRIG